MRKYVFVLIDDYGCYEPDDCFDDPIMAIEMAMSGSEIGCLDAFSLEYLGSIR